VLLHVNLEISQDKKVSLGNIATAIKGLEIESKITEQIIQTIDENRYKRGGTSEREPVTAVGKLNVTLHKVVDTEANKTFKLINSVVDFEGKRIYQEDISMIAVELATKMTSYVIG
jgi:hypothetical protein